MKKYRFLRSWSAILPSVRLFVWGASEAGKSTLVKALQKEDNWIKGRFVPVDGVEMHTSGVIPVNYESSAFGKVTIYDFAGHEEYYSSHEALLDKTGHSLPIFFIVIDLQKEKEELKHQISYWRGFIMQATCSSNMEPKIMYWEAIVIYYVSKISHSKKHFCMTYVKVMKEQDSSQSTVACLHQGQ